MIIRNRLSSISIRLARPLEVQPRHPDIAETDIIDSAVFLINDPQPVALDALESLGEVAGGRRGAPARLADRLRHDRGLGLDPHPAPGEALRVFQRVDPPFQTR